MLGYLTALGQGAGDRLLATVAARLAEDGWPIAGAVQSNVDRRGGGPCHMDLHVIAGHEVIRISQNLGQLATGCRLDPAGLEQAVGLVGRALDAEGADKPRLLIINKFGKQEAEGRGFRPLIGRALTEEIPVLTAVGPSNLEAFHAFAGEFADPVAPELDAVLAWVRGRLGAAA